MRYPTEIEEKMIKFYNTLSEKEQRRYMGLESLKLGEGSKKYIYELFGSDYHRLQKGLDSIMMKPLSKIGRTLTLTTTIDSGFGFYSKKRGK